MKITTIRLPDELHKRAIQFLNQKEMNLSGLVRLAIRRYLEENERKTNL